jgi:hypothetical protein
MSDDNQKPAEPSYYIAKRGFTHEPVCFLKCHRPDDLNRHQQDAAGAWMFQVEVVFGCNGVPRSNEGYYVLRNRKKDSPGFEDDANMYFEPLTASECESFSALLKLPYHNLFDE